jgi:hypothetical protein
MREPELRADRPLDICTFVSNCSLHSANAARTRCKSPRP